MAEQTDVPIIVSVGAGVQDVFLSGKIFTPHYDEGDWEQQFKVGQKYELEHITFSTGGGATNAAVTFARQGLNAIFMGKIGTDPAGRAVINDLEQEHVNTRFIKTDENINTGYSVLLVSPSGDRAVLTYRGASADFEVNDFDLKNLRGDWLYLSTMAGKLEVVEHIVTAAKTNNMKVAINPGKGELAQPDRLKALLHQIDVLTLNKEELELLVEGDSDEQLVRHASDMSPTVVMTDGPRGVTATDRSKVVKAGMYEDVPVIDRTGAGDAFGSGLIAMIAQGKDLAEAVKFASANSTSVVNQIGAKAGILSKDTQLHDMPLEVTEF